MKTLITMVLSGMIIWIGIKVNGITNAFFTEVGNTYDTQSLDMQTIYDNRIYVTVFIVVIVVVLITIVSRLIKD